MQSESVSTPAAPQSPGEAAILDAAVRLFSVHGYDGVSMRRIAEAAGVSKANIYHHFASKDALHYAIMRRSARQLSVLVEGLAEGEGEFADRLRAFGKAHIQHLFDNATTLQLVLREAFAADPERGRALVDQVLGDVFKRLLAIFRDGQQAGYLRDDLDPGLCATLLMGGDLFFFQSRGLLQQIPGAEFACDAEQYSRQMTDVLLHGMLRAPAPGRQP